MANLQIADILTPWAPSGLQLRSDYDIGHSLGHWVSDLGDPANVPKWELEMKENREWRMGLVKLIADGLNSPDFLKGGAPARQLADLLLERNSAPAASTAPPTAPTC